MQSEIKDGGKTLLLIKQLRQEHTKIINSLVEIKKLGSTSSTAQGKIKDLRDILLKHLKTEDEGIYAILKKKGEENPHLKYVLEPFIQEMAGTSKSVLEFFEKYSHGDSNQEFLDNFEQFFNIIENRIKKEEKLLNSAYQKYKS